MRRTAWLDVMRETALLGLVLTSGCDCGGSPAPDASVESPADAWELDGGRDAAIDVGEDAFPVADGGADAGLEPARWTRLVSGHDFTCGLTRASALHCWGRGPMHGAGARSLRLEAVTPVGLEARRIVSVAAGAQHACAADSEGSLSR